MQVHTTHMRIALVQVSSICHIHMRFWLTSFVVRCSCFGYWGPLRCSLPQWPRCHASFGWTSCQPHQEPNCTCWSQVMNMSDGGSLKFSALMCLLWCQWVWGPCPCSKSERGQNVQHRLMVWLDVMQNSTLISCSQTWQILLRQPIAQPCKPCMLLSRSSYAGICNFVECASVQAVMCAMYCHRCVLKKPVVLFFSFVLFCVALFTLWDLRKNLQLTYWINTWLLLNEVRLSLW